MDDLEIRIVLRYKVSEKGLTFNGLLRGLEKDKDMLVRCMILAMLEALEEKAIEEAKEKDPGRFVRNGRRTRYRKFLTSFGAVHYRLAQVYDRKRCVVFCPLVKRLGVIPYRQDQRESLEAAVGQVIHLSYRKASEEVRRIKGQGLTKSTLHRVVEEISAGWGG